MPELTRFYGIIVRMSSEAGGVDQAVYFHANFQSEAAVFSIEPVELIAESIIVVPGIQTRQ